MNKSMAEFERDPIDDAQLSDFAYEFSPRAKALSNR